MQVIVDPPRGEYRGGGGLVYPLNDSIHDWGRLMTAAETVDAGEIPALVNRFTNEPYQGTGVLSVYLDTSPTRVPDKEYLLSLREAVRRLRPSIPDDQASAFESAVHAAEAMAAAAVPGRLGLALFAGDQPSINTIVQIPIPAVDTAVWGPEPDIQLLREVADERQRIAVVLFDSSQARLFTIYLGQIEEQAVVEGDVPGRQSTGGWFGLSQKRWDRHRQNELQRHARNAVATLQRELEAHPFERLFLGGSSDSVTLFKNQLPDPLLRRLAGTLKVEMFASPAQVLEASLREAEAVERREETELVVRLLDKRTAPNVVIGLAPVLDALSQGKVNRLVVTEFPGVAGYECTSCGRIVGGGGACPVCSGDLQPLPNLRSAIIERALAQGARVDFLHGEAAQILNEFGVTAAWTWY